MMFSNQLVDPIRTVERLSSNYGQKALSYIAQTIWNSPLSSLKKSEGLNICK